MSSPLNALRACLLAAPMVFALTACGGETVVEDPGDPAQIAEAMAALPEPEPGEYSITGELVEIDIPGASEEEIGMMRGLFSAGLSTTQSFCMTPEMASKGHQEWITQSQNVPEGCEFSEYKTSGDGFDATMACSGNDGTSGTIKLTGAVTATSNDMRMEMDMANPMQQGGNMRMVVETKSKRTGDCA